LLIVGFPVETKTPAGPLELAGGVGGDVPRGGRKPLVTSGHEPDCCGHSGTDDNPCVAFGDL